MSFLSSLFSGRSGDSDDEFDQSEEFPELYNGMTLDLITKEGAPLLSGKITAFSETAMTLERLPGCLSFPTFSIGTRVWIRGYNQGMVPFSMSATVQESSRIVCRLRELKALPFSEHRLNFRLPAQIPVSLHYQHDTHLENPEACPLVDISTGGACIESEYLHAEDEVLRLRVKLEEYKPMEFLGQIIRVTEPSPGHFRYGFLFAQLREDELTELTKTLYNLQVGNRREWRRTDVGHW